MKQELVRILSKLRGSLEELERLSFEDRVQVLNELTAFRGVFESAPGYQELDRRYNLAIEGANDGIWDWDISSDYVIYSDRWAQVLGYESAKELEPSLESWSSHIHPDDYAKAIQPVNDHLDGKNTFMPEAVYRMIKKDGSIIYTAHRGKAHFDNEGKPVRMVGTTRDVNEEIALRNKLLDQNSFINSILNLSPQLIFVKDKFGNFRKVNQSIANLFNTTIEELESKHNSAVHGYQDELDAYDAVEKEVLRTKKSIAVEEKFTNSNGVQRIFHTLKTPLVRPDGETDVLGISNDITELRTSQIQLLKQERDFRNTLESMRAVIGRLDQNMRFTYFNPALVHYIQFESLEQVMHLPIKRMIHEDDLPNFAEDFRSVLNRESRLEEGKVRFRKGDELFWFEYALTLQEQPVSNSEVLVSLHDISEQILFSRELERSERIFRTIAINSADIIGLHDAKGRIKYTSPATKILLGYDQADVSGKHALYFIHPNDRQRIRSLIPLITDSDAPNVNRFIQLRVKQKNGEYRWMEMTASLISVDDSEDDVMIQTASRDISERMKIEDERQQNMQKEAELNAFQQSFVMMSSHQLRTPLTVIKSDVDLLSIMADSNSKVEKDRVSRVVKRMKTSVNRMTYLMEDILTLGKLDAGAIETEIKPTPIIAFFDELIQNQFSPLKSGRSIKCNFDLEETIVLTDKNLLGQAIANFLTNADKYSEGKNPPELNIYAHDDHVQVKIQDFGIGVPVADQSQLFMPFFRGSNTKDYKGTGLGLRIAKNFLDMIECQMLFTSAENEGTTITVEIPKV